MAYMVLGLIVLAPATVIITRIYSDYREREAQRYYGGEQYRPLAQSPGALATLGLILLAVWAFWPVALVFGAAYGLAKLAVKWVERKDDE